MKDYYIESTGELYNDECLFKHLIIKEKAFSLDLLNELTKLFKPDYISIKKYGELTFTHISELDNCEFIMKNGLTITDYNHDLGKEIYVVNNNDFFSVENLKNYVLDTYSENFLVIEGFYKGFYLECISNNDHKGYIVLLENISTENINNIEEYKLDDFLLNY